MSDVLIIGGGQAGSMVAINLRKKKFEGSISVITEEANYPYQRPPLSKGFLTGKNNPIFQTQEQRDKQNPGLLSSRNRSLACLPSRAGRPQHRRDH